MVKNSQAMEFAITACLPASHRLIVRENVVLEQGNLD
jgi:hypothetical protein